VQGGLQARGARHAESKLRRRIGGGIVGGDCCRPAQRMRSAHHQRQSVFLRFNPHLLTRPRREPRRTKYLSRCILKNSPRKRGRTHWLTLTQSLHLPHKFPAQRACFKPLSTYRAFFPAYVGADVRSNTTFYEHPSGSENSAAHMVEQGYITA